MRTRIARRHPSRPAWDSAPWPTARRQKSSALQFRDRPLLQQHFATARQPPFGWPQVSTSIDSKRTRETALLEVFGGIPSDRRIDRRQMVAEPRLSAASGARRGVRPSPSLFRCDEQQGWCSAMPPKLVRAADVLYQARLESASPAPIQEDAVFGYPPSGSVVISCPRCLRRWAPMVARMTRYSLLLLTLADPEDPIATALTRAERRPRWLGGLRRPDSRHRHMVAIAEGLARPDAIECVVDTVVRVGWKFPVLSRGGRLRPDCRPTARLHRGPTAPGGADTHPHNCGHAITRGLPSRPRSMRPRGSDDIVIHGRLLLLPPGCGPG